MDKDKAKSIGGLINSVSDFDHFAAHYRRLPPQHESNELQINRSCPLCGQSNDKELFKLADFQFYGDQHGKNRVTHRIVTCRDCYTLYTNPCYTNRGFEVLFEKAAMSYGHTPARSNEQCQWLLTRIPECTSVLDFGCGDGAFLKSLPATIRCFGVDANLNVIDVAENIEFKSIDYSDSIDIPSVDVVTLFHVLEHLIDPLATLVLLRKKLPDNARLVVEVPVIDRAVQEQGQDIVGFFTVQHLTHFSKSSLEIMLAKAGWEIKFRDDIDGYNGHRVLAHTGRQQTGIESSRVNTDIEVDAYLETWHRNVKKVSDRLDLLPLKNIVIWGAGQHTEYLALLTNLFVDTRRYLIVDSDPSKHGTKMHGIPILSADEISEDLWRDGDFNIVISSYGSQDAIKDILLKKGVQTERIVCLYDKTNRY